LAEVLGEKRVAGLRVNLDSMAWSPTSTRLGAIREHFERCVADRCRPALVGHRHPLVSLIYGELETRKLAVEAGVAKNTLSGILNTLEGRKLVKRAFQ